MVMLMLHVLTDCTVLMSLIVCPRADCPADTSVKDVVRTDCQRTKRHVTDHQDRILGHLRWTAEIQNNQRTQRGINLWRT